MIRPEYRLFAVAGALALGRSAQVRGEELASLSLREGWSLQSSCDAKATGAEISAAGFSTSGWHATQVPATVVGALVADKTYPDPLVGMNMRSLPGMAYPIGRNFSNLPMPADSPFACPWWYRTEFRLPDAPKGRTWWLRFDGINYRANVWLNGEKLADANDVKGTFRIFEFDITARVHAGKANA